MAHLKVSAVRFKCESTKLKSEGWESGIAVIVEDITMSIIDMKGKPIVAPYQYHFTVFLVNNIGTSFMTQQQNIKTEPPYTQVCVWPGTSVLEPGVPDKIRIKVFEEFMLKEFNTRVQYLEEIKTAPDMKDGYPVQGTGGRIDLFFVAHSEDLGRFAVPRLKAGIRWVEDVIDNEKHRDNGSIYPERVQQYWSWKID